MAIITSTGSLTLGTDIVIDTSALTIRILTSGAVSNAGSTGGVLGQTLYSWLKEQWKTSSTFIKFPFPMTAITPEEFEFTAGWKPYDDTTRSLIRTAGWAEINASGVVNRKYMGVVSLGSIGGTDQPYYNWGTSDAVNFAFAGPVNQAVQIYGDSANGNFDYTGGATTFTVYVRTQGKTYGASTAASIGASTLTYQTYRFPLSNSTDLNISASDATIASSAPWNQISIQYYTTDQNRTIDGTSAPFRIIVTDASGAASTQQIYEKIQWSLRQTTDIDTGSGVVKGNIAASLLSFLGSTLVGTTGLAVDGLNANYKNSVNFYDKNGVERLYPFIAAGTINFGSNATSGDFQYWLFFSSTPSGNYGTSSAVIVQDASAANLAGTYSGSPVSFSFAYDTNTQGGRTAGTDAAVKVVGIGLATGQYIEVDATLTRAVGQSILLAPALERNFVA